MEVQMARVETRVRTEEREKADAEKDELRRQLETEIGELRSNLNRLQKVRIFFIFAHCVESTCAPVHI